MNSQRPTYIIAGILLTIVFLLAVFSIKNDVFTFDETAHVASGFSYLTQKDYRLNPEHPPLIKDLSAFPLLFLNLNFPKDHPSWMQEEPPQWWFQFDFASQFLYHSGNNPDQILFWSRIPMILLLIFLGWSLFYVTKKMFGNKTALLTLFFFSFSPTFLAHGRLITTDVGAALGVVLSTYFWLKFLKNPTKNNIVLTGIIFGLVMLIKFSLILLIPFFGFITLVYAVTYADAPPFGKRWGVNILKYLGLALLVGIIGIIFVIWPVYQYHIFDYPPQQQIRDTQFLLQSTSVPKFLIQINLRLVEIPILRPLSQYLLGLLLAINRSATGHTTFFLGEISAEGWKSYFPVVYLIKEPLAFHFFTLITLLYLAWLFKKPSKNWVKSHFPEFTMLTFLGIYWLTSLTSKLNIGVRHLLPAFPFTMVLVSVVICNYWLKGQEKTRAEPTYFNKQVKPMYFMYFNNYSLSNIIKYSLIVILLFWQAVSVISIYPYFLSYFNEIVGGPEQGHIYAVDSNLDWGQDLKRLQKWVDEKGINQIYVDYFGGGDAQYYLKEKFAPWWGTRDPKEFPKGNYLAVSVSQLQGGRGMPVAGFDQPYGYYFWLYQYEPPIKKIGHSIFIYQVPLGAGED